MTPKTLFIADLHLSDSRPDITAAFVDFIAQLQQQTIDALYILGDLFEVWLGDDYLDKTARTVANTLADYHQTNQVPVYFIHGNRDFLLGQHYAARAKMTLLPEHDIINLYGTKTLIMHGDTLCTDDAAYQSFRKKVHSSEWQAAVLRLPVWIRKLKAANLRRRSKKINTIKPQILMDVNAQAVSEVMTANHITQLIHGHTHRPASHQLKIDEKPATRYVLGDWFTQGSFLEVTPQRAKLVKLSLHQISA